MSFHLLIEALPKCAQVRRWPGSDQGLEWRAELPVLQWTAYAVQGGFTAPVEALSLPLSGAGESSDSYA